MSETVSPYDDEVRDPYEGDDVKNPHEGGGDTEPAPAEEETPDEAPEEAAAAPTKRAPGRPKKPS